MTLGECNKKWRLGKDLFQKDLAKTMGVDDITIISSEKHRSR